MTVQTPGLAGAGDLSELHPGEVTRTLLALFAGASGDHNPIHIDTDEARAAGFDDVLAHGMLSMAFLGHLVTSWVPIGAVRSLKARFLAPTPVHARPCCTGRISGLEVGAGGERLARIALAVRLEDGTVTVRGEAVVAADALPAAGD
ncbi:MaoC/PaaZ C-terminal domain-containing protein [Streptomyces sp. CSDS2]|uniref:MaoC/PaaZ C-terminal domain-containing protein n=1 Tax=Streptomyces sp. CSDS2 TaxID=3055051 RepID=UPI0025B087CF|nr:MaoC/PaaZ C-terminal domain-containing protein [Streptomyces sp. CSDS2]MDN3259822.1 MaoC/PaaZ C-terminal domain-containing protein [Streptomyces sp. CSDS2]